MVSVSPRLRDNLEEDEPDDPRFVLGFRSVSIGSSDYEEYEPQDDHRPYSAGSDPAASRRRRRHRQSGQRFENLEPHEYQVCADGELFRLFELRPGTGRQPIEGRLILQHFRRVEHDYTCLSYCWESVDREEWIICDGFKFSVTRNLLAAMRCLRKPRQSFFIWADQICINQEDLAERGHQVSIMQHIFSQAKDVIVWLGEADDRSGLLCEYARRMRRGDDSPRQVLSRILTPRQLQDAIQKLLLRPWFQRVWVVPEVALSRFTIVQIGQDQISWDNLVRLVKDVPFQQTGGFDKQTSLLGNPRQRIAIITQMSSSQREGLAHTDITQLLILGKGSRATDVRDFVYAFYGLTWLRTFPDYFRPVEVLFAEIIQHYVNSIRWDASYSSLHDLTEQKRTQQLMSILYSAGTLQQHYALPSWIPDWTVLWRLAPIWCKTTSNIVVGSGKDEWSSGVRCDFRAGGEECGEFEVLEEPHGMHQLRVSAIVFDTITIVSETTPATTPGADDDHIVEPDPSLRYGREFFRTGKGHMGLATPGVKTGDDVAVILGGDVPVVIRPLGSDDKKAKSYKLLCECFILNEAVMRGEIARASWTVAEDIVFL